MRLALAQALFVPSDLLLLDEPTNHLDLHALSWLTDYLAQSDHTVIVVSHDRAFLDVCTDMITMEHKKLTYFVGNYSAYRLQQQEKAARQAQILDASERQRAKAMAFVQKQQQHQSKKKGVDPKKQRQAKMIKEKKMDRIGNYRDDGKRYKQFSLAKLGEEHVRLAQKVHIGREEYKIVKMKFPDPSWPSGVLSDTPLIKVEEMSFGYQQGQPYLLNNMTMALTRNSKIALVGRNGAGKSTLLKLLTQDLSPSGSEHRFRGSMWRHPSLRIGHIDQYSVEALEEFASMSVVEYMEDIVMKSGSVSAETQKIAHGGNIRQYLGAFALGDSKITHRRIKCLSGGERMRLCFATVMVKQPHLLVLDEPTNHLDLETLDSLSMALNPYAGAVLIVSHNQGFLSGFCKELWVVSDNGMLEIRHQDESGFGELFSQYKQESLGGNSAESRNAHRQSKAALSRRATRQSAGARAGTGFIP